MKNQISLFDIVDDIQNPGDNLPNIPEYPSAQLLAMEKEVLGVYISGHPLLEYKQELMKNATFFIADINDKKIFGTICQLL